jgi:hypothetical protein
VTLQRVPMPSPNYSARNPEGVTQAVIHTAEGATTITSLGNYFSSSAVQASSHAGADDTPNTIGVYVRRSDKAWTQANANPWAVSMELCAFAAWDRAEWNRHPEMLRNCARWIAEEAAAFGFPITRINATQAQAGQPGVCQHIDLGSMGGGHSDCDYGTGNFPMDDVLDMARGGVDPTPPAPSTDGSVENMILVDQTTGGVWVCDPNSTPPGAVFSYDGAPYCGGTNNDKMNAQSFPCVGIDANPDSKGGGYVIVLDFGEIPGQDRFRRYRFPRNGSGKA